MAINELIDPISRIKSKELYINEKCIDAAALNDYVENIELECNYFRHSLIAVFSCFEELFTLSIGKSPNAISEKDTVRIIFEDKSGTVFDRRFNIVSITKQKEKTSNRSVQWVVTLEDIFGYTLNSSNYTRYLTEAGFSGTPFEICTKAINTLFRYPNELSKKYGDKQVKISTKRNVLDFVTDDNPTIKYMFSKDLTPIQNILKLADKYNIHLYQDFDNFHIIQNPNFIDGKYVLNGDSTSLFKEQCDCRTYPYKICDKIKQNNSISTIDKVNYRISLNNGGKEQCIRELNFDDILKVIDINNNTDEFKNTRCENTLEVSSGYSLISTLLNDSYKKYLKTSNVVIYTRPTLPYCVPGTLTTIDLNVNSEFLNTRAQGDYRYSGIWLIRSTTLKIFNNQYLIGRMVLCRFDNQPDSGFEEVKDTITIDSNDEVLTEKPEKPKNLQESKDYYDTSEKQSNNSKSDSNFLKSIESSSCTVSQFMSIISQLSALDSVIETSFSSVDSFITTFETINSFKDKIMAVASFIPSEAKDNVIDTVTITLNNTYNNVQPVLTSTKNTLTSVKEFVCEVTDTTKTITDSVREAIGNTEEIVSRIVNMIRKVKSKIYASLTKIENLILKEIKQYCDVVVFYLEGLVKALATNIFKAIMDSVIDASIKASINPMLVLSAIHLVMKTVFVDPLCSIIKDQVYGVLKSATKYVRTVRNTIDTIVNTAMTPFTMVENTLTESIELVNNTITAPQRILQKVQQQGVNIFRQSPKEIINSTKTTIKQDTQRLKNKRENILKGLR